MIKAYFLKPSWKEQDKDTFKLFFECSSTYKQEAESLPFAEQGQVVILSEKAYESSMEGKNTDILSTLERYESIAFKHLEGLKEIYELVKEKSESFQKTLEEKDAILEQNAIKIAELEEKLNSREHRLAQQQNEALGITPVSQDNSK
jgi:hypothetical protein